MTSSPASGARARILPIALLVLGAAVWFAPLFAVELRRLLDSWGDVPIPDDALYFLQVARHMAAGNGSTFDGVHPTNGYQPLWTYLLAALQIAGRFDREGFVLASLALSLVLLQATAWQLLRIVEEAGGDRRLGLVVAAAAVASPLLSQNYASLTEAPLNGFVLALAFRLSARWMDGRLTAADQVGTGLVLGLLFLARLDNAFLIALLFGLVLLRPAARPSLLRVGLPAALIAVAYLLSNVLCFGHLMPISGAMKSYWAGPPRWTDVGWLGARLTETLFWFVGVQPLTDDARLFPRVLLIVALGWLLLPVRVWLGRRGGPWSSDGWTWVSGTCLAAFLGQQLYYAFFQRFHNNVPWYFVTEEVALLAFLGIGLARQQRSGDTEPRAARAAAWLLVAGWIWANWPSHRLRWPDEPSVWIPMLLAGAAWSAAFAAAPARPVPGSRAPSWRALAVLPLLLLFTSAQYRQTLATQPPYRTEKGRLHDLGRWARQVRLTDHGRAGAYSAGLIGYFGGGDITNLDGLVADWEWFELAKELGVVPPPRRETFVLDYWQPSLPRFLEGGYVLVLDSLPRYAPVAHDHGGVYVLTTDRDRAEDVYLDVLRDEGQPAVVREHAVETALRLDLPRVRAALALEPLASFDGSLEGWRPDGPAFDAQPARGPRPRQGAVTGFAGGFVDSFHPEDGDAATGTLTSPARRIQADFVVLSVAGGDGSGVGVRLLADGEVVAVVRGARTSELRRRAVDLARHRDRTLVLEAFDEQTGPWGHVMLDDVWLVRLAEAR